MNKISRITELYSAIEKDAEEAVSRRVSWVDKLKCFFGFHSWNYMAGSTSHHRRKCLCCPVKHFKLKHEQLTGAHKWRAL